MRSIMAACVLLAIIGVWSAVTGIQSIASSGSGTVITYHHGAATRLLAIAWAAVCAVVAYCVYRRHVFGWWLGWVIVAAAPLDIFYGALSNVTLQRPMDTYALVIEI